MHISDFENKSTFAIFITAMHDSAMAVLETSSVSDGKGMTP